MLKIYTYWRGPNQHVKANEGIEYIVGPTEEDHEFLLKNYSFYRSAFADGKYAYCSDVWRFYMLYENGGAYVDYNLDVLDGFLHFWDQLDKSKIQIIKEKNFIYSCGFLYFPKKNHSDLGEVLKFYEKYEYDSDVIVPCPQILSIFLKDNNVEWQHPEIYLKKNNVFSKNKGNSWKDKKEPLDDLWISIIKNFDKEKWFVKAYWWLYTKSEATFRILLFLIKIIPLKRFKLIYRRNLSIRKTILKMK